MQQFINYFMQLFADIHTCISNFFGVDYQTFLSKQVFNGSMLSTPMTFGEMFRFLLPIVCLILFVVFIVRFCKKLLGVFGA